MGDNFKNIKDTKITNRSTIQSDRGDANLKPWYKRPIGIVFLGVLAGIASAYISLKLGW